MRLRSGLAYAAVASWSTTALAGAANTDQSVTLWSWPLSFSSPLPLAEITYNANTTLSSVAKYTPPQISFSPDNYVRVGLYNHKTSEWRGVLTSAASFDLKYQRKAELLVDENGDTYHVGFFALTRPELSKKAKKSRSRKAARATAKDAEKRSKKNPQQSWVDPEENKETPLIVEIVHPTPGPTPVLNKPVVVDPAGKVEGKEPEKTFLQKYVSSVSSQKAKLTCAGIGGRLLYSFCYKSLPQGADQKTSHDRILSSFYTIAFWATCPRPGLHCQSFQCCDSSMLH